MMRYWLQITSGQGPAECTWVVPRLLRSIVEDATNCALRTEMLEAVPAYFPDTLYSVLIAVDGINLNGFLERWVGTVLWIGRSPFRPDYKRKNWYVGVKHLVVPENPEWSQNELRFETMKSSGPGGQHVNKTESAVRVTHVPSGMTAVAREERSQAANRKLALARLTLMFLEKRKTKEQQIQTQRWMQHSSLERGNAIRVFEGPRFSLRSSGY